MTFQRYAIYYTPPEGPLASFGAAWLGWDIDRGCTVEHPDIDGLPLPPETLTETPRRYGFHGTIKPPFRLAEASDEHALIAATARLTRTLAPITVDGLCLTRLGSFLALTPVGETAPLSALAANAVRGLDEFRRSADEAELARRRTARLSDRQQANLLRWGYPYVMEDFRFHMTLTNRLPSAEARQVQSALDPVVDPLLPKPFTIDALTLVGEDGSGQFHTIQRFTLSATRA